MPEWKTISRLLVLERGKWLRVEDHVVELPDGRVIRDWPWVITPDFVNVLVQIPEGNFICFRQNKYAVDGYSLAPVGGYIEPGEDPLLAAKRETLEEVGYEAPDWVYLGSFPVDGNRGAGTAHFYLAQNARFVGHTISDDLEQVEVVSLSQEELEMAFMAGEFKLLSWAAIVSHALLYLKNK
jgi:ADP-ribose pyrophosphatase